MPKTPSDLSNHPLTIRLFGPPEVRVHGTPLPPLRSRKGIWLLALLVFRAGRAVERSWLAGTLWPDSPESQSLYSLRRSLTDLRHALGDQAECLHAPTPHSLCLTIPETAADVLAFDAASAQGDLDSLQKAVALYRGPLLEGCTEEWVLQERAAREQTYLAALQTLASLARESGDAGAAIGYLRCLLAADPFRESAYRALMDALGESGDFTSATQVYRELRVWLRREMNADPDAATTVLFQRLRQESQSSSPTILPAPHRTAVAHSASRSDASQDSPQHNLPAPVTSFIGRMRELAEVKGLVQHHRLVTLTGTGGSGKTRLALQVAENLLSAYPDGVWLVELAALSDPILIPQTIAVTLGIASQPDRPPLQTLIGALRRKSLLLVLDNCEHLVEACAQLVASILQGCPALHLLATSRIALNVQGGITWRVPSLLFPQASSDQQDEKDSLAALSEFDSVRLFVERAQGHRPGFLLNRGNATAVVQICRRLDGIPLALELAAAWVQALSAEQIAARLDDRFRLLTRGNQGALPRHRTLEAALDWSYDLLSAQEKALLYRLSVFVGGWTLEAAETVCADGEEDTTATLLSGEIALLLARLLDNSLILAESQQEMQRFRMLETISQYAAHHPIAPGDREALCRRHRDWYLALVEQSVPHLIGPEQVVWLNMLEVEHDNLRAALDFCNTEPEGAESGLRMVAAMWRFWETHGYLTEGRRRCKEALERIEAQGRTLLRVQALYGAGDLALHQNDLQAVRALLTECLEISRERQCETWIATSLDLLGRVALDSEELDEAQKLFSQALQQFRTLNDREGIAGSLNNLGRVARGRGDFATALRLHTESLTAWQELGDRRGLAAAYINLGKVAQMQSDFPTARAHYERSLALKQELGDRQGIAMVLANLGQILCDMGDYAEARSCHEQALRIRRDLSNPESIAASLNHLAEVALTQGDYPNAQILLEESLALCRECGDKRGCAFAFDNLAILAGYTGDITRARQLCEESMALHREIGDPFDIALTLANLGELSVEVGDLTAGQNYLAESLHLRQELGDRGGIAYVLRSSARLAKAQNRQAYAVALYAASDRLFRETGVVLSAASLEGSNQSLEKLRTALGGEAFTAAWEKGASLPWEEVVSSLNGDSEQFNAQ